MSAAGRSALTPASDEHLYPTRCSSARDRQILIDSTVADAVRDDLFVVELGTRQLKGYDEEVYVFDAGDSGSVEHVMQTSVSASLSSTSTNVR